MKCHECGTTNKEEFKSKWTMVDKDFEEVVCCDKCVEKSFEEHEKEWEERKEKK